MHGPSGFSLALMRTASGGRLSTRESWASAGSLKNGIAAAPPVIIAAIRPRCRREKPRFTKSLFSLSFSTAFINPSCKNDLVESTGGEHPRRVENTLLDGRLAGSETVVKRRFVRGVASYPERGPEALSETPGHRATYPSSRRAP